MLGGALMFAATTQTAAADTSSMGYFSARAAQSSVPEVLNGRDKAYYSEVFAAIHNEQWDKASALLAERDTGPLHPIAKAELYLAANSPRVEMGPLLALINEAPDIPQAEQLGRLAEKRGAMMLPSLPQVQQLASFSSAPRRGKPRGIGDGSMPSYVGEIITDRIVNDDPDGAYEKLREVEGQLSEQARTEWQQRVAWSYYIENRDADARRLAEVAMQGSGDWAGEAAWVAGLAAWRMGDCAAALQGFDRAARTGSNEELRAASYYWAARAQTRCRRPDMVEATLKAAAQYGETFYGLIAAEQLGMDIDPGAEPADFGDGDWRQLKSSANVGRAIALAEIGEDVLADEALRHQARIANPGDHDALLRLARDLGLVQTQIFLAHNGPRGERPASYARFPSPKWTPANGWRVDPALVYAHSLQESAFQSNARSPADARGLMQVRPGTASDMARARGESLSASDLYKPSVNLEYGQRYLESLRDMPQTQGLLPKVIAAYNAGPAPVGRWNYEVRDQGDPLLFIESIPYYETRAYVGIILRNYWMYERQAGVRPQSAAGLAQGYWPRFPDQRGIEFVRAGSGGR